jgi:hypothetical protein
MSQPPIDPPRLVNGSSVASDMLREARQHYDVGLDEPRAWKRLETKWDKRARRPRAGWFVVYGLAAGFACWLVFQHFRHGSPIDRADTTARLAPSATPAPPSTPLDNEPREEPTTNVTPSPAPRSLAAGPTRLTDGSIVRVARASKAEVSAPSSERTRIDLAEGTVDLEVAHQDPGHSLEVAGGAYRFVALGTKFRVTVMADRVVLEVSEGLVGVVSGNRMLARVPPSGSWSSPPEPPRPAAPPPRPATTLTKVDCLTLARSGKTREAVSCYETLATTSDATGAEVALYEAAQLRKDVLSDYAGALDAFRRLKAKFPRGALSCETDLAILEVLERAGKSQEALAESDRLLSTPCGRERQTDIRRLRDDIHRKSGGATDDPKQRMPAR